MEENQKNKKKENNMSIIHCKTYSQRSVHSSI